MDKIKEEFMSACALYILDQSLDKKEDFEATSAILAKTFPEYDGVSARQVFKSLAPQRHTELVALLNEANRQYYDNDVSIMTNQEWDTLMQELKVLEEVFPALISPESPTQHAGNTAGKDSLNKVVHAVPLLSLEDVFSVKEMERRMANAQDAVGNNTALYSVEPKVDGLSTALEYIDGVFVRGSTRGDSRVGEDVTENLKMIRSVPQKISGAPHRLIVRGEVFMPKTAFEQMNAERMEAGLELRANPRNAAAGALRQKDPEETRKANLDIFIFDLLLAEGDGAGYQTHAQALAALSRMGFKTIPHRMVEAKDVPQAITDLDASRGIFPCDIDGAAVKLDYYAYRKALGETNKYPKWAWAYKYPPEEKETTVKEIILQTGRTGKVTPVAVFDPPLYLSGTKVERATLNNQTQIARLGVNIGDTVRVRKAAEIIPEIVCVTKKVQEGEYSITAHTCPSCGGPITPNDAGTEEFCINPNCPAQMLRHLEFFASRDVMDIRGLGPNLIKIFYDAGFLRSTADIYRLKGHADEMAKMEGMGEKTVKNLLDAIETSKQNDIDRVIKGLGMKDIGRHIGRALAQRYTGLLSEIVKLSEEELRKIDGVGSVAAHTMRTYFDDPENIRRIEELRDLGVNMASKSYVGAASNATEGSLVGKTFVITGTLSQPRSYFEQLIIKNGGKTSGSVSKKTSYLLVGEDAGSKLTKAQSLGVPTLTEEDFMEMLR